MLNEMGKYLMKYYPTSYTYQYRIKGKVLLVDILFTYFNIMSTIPPDMCTVGVHEDFRELYTYSAVRGKESIRFDSPNRGLWLNTGVLR